MPFLVDVEATIDVPNMYVAPQVRFSYPGSAELLQLWEDLEAIGWQVPPRPPIPYQASNWEGDRGRRSRNEYRVEDFEVTADDWPLYEIADRGIETINLLRRSGVDVKMPISYLDFLRKTQLQERENKKLPPAARGAAPSNGSMPAAVRHSQQAGSDQPRDVDGPLLARPKLEIVPDQHRNKGVQSSPAQSVDIAGPAPALAAGGPAIVAIPQVVLLSTKAWSVLQTEPDLDVYQSVVVPGRTRWTWSQTTRPVDELGKTLPDPRILFETIELGWQRTSDEVPALTMDPKTQRTLWFIVHQFSEANELVAFLHEQLETSARVVPMSPLPRTTAFDECFLVGAVVPAKEFAKIGSKVVANYGDAIARGKPSPLADTLTTFSR